MVKSSRGHRLPRWEATPFGHWHIITRFDRFACRSKAMRYANPQKRHVSYEPTFAAYNTCKACTTRVLLGYHKPSQRSA